MTTAEEGNLDQGSAETKDDLHGDIAAAMDAAEKPDISEAARTLASARQSGEAKPADAGEVTGPVVKDNTVVGDKSEDTTAVQTDAIEAPQHWPAQDREMFGKQPPEVKTFLLNRHKAMEADYTRKTQELAPVRRFKEQLDEIMGPYREGMAREGIDDAMAIKQLVAAHAYLQQDPQAGIQWLAQKYGIDLKGMTASTETTGQLPPQFTQLQQTVAQLEKRLKDEAQRTQEEQHQATVSQIEQFANEKDAAGQPIRPHFDEVAGDIARLIKAAKLDGQTITLQDAYDRAIYANPQTRAKVLAAQDAQRKAKEAEERQAKANAAKKAGFDVKGQGAATAVVAQSNSVRADLEAAIAEHGGRV